jgi:hypothetical protein
MLLRLTSNFSPQEPSMPIFWESLRIEKVHVFIEYFHINILRVFFPQVVSIHFLKSA